MAPTDTPRETEQQEEMAPTSGKKRKRSPSSSLEPESRKRALSINQSPSQSPRILESAKRKFSKSESPKSESPNNESSTFQTLKPLEPDDPGYCPKCGRRCWLCNLSSPVPLEQSKPREEEELLCKRMPSDGSLSNTESSSVASSSKKRKQHHYTLLGLKRIGPRDKGFEEYILDPLGVIWGKIPPPKERPSQVLKSQPLPRSKVIIRTDDEDLEGIAMEFKQYKKRHYDEHSLFTAYINTLIRKDFWIESALADRVADNSEEEPVVKDQKPIITSVRRDKWKPQQLEPTILDRFVYDWDLEPDTTYAVSIRMFDIEYLRKLHTVTFKPWVAERDVAVCPYLTFEYKSLSKGGKQQDATNQATAAAILWLNQRKGLGKAIGKGFDGLSHFFITLVDSFYTIFKARLGLDGYTVGEQVTGDLTLIDDLKLYIEWSNAIHAWGLGANASAFKQDIEDLVKLNDAQVAPSSLPTPAGTVSPVGPSVRTSAL